MTVSTRGAKAMHFPLRLRVGFLAFPICHPERAALARERTYAFHRNCHPERNHGFAARTRMESNDPYFPQHTTGLSRSFASPQNLASPWKLRIAAEPSQHRISF